MKFAARAARICIGLAAAGSGLMQIVNADFVRLVVKPAWFPWPEIGAAASGLVLTLAGAALAVGKYVRVAAVVLTVLLLVALFFRLPEVLARPGTGFVWTNPSKTLALAGGVLLAAGMPVGVPRLAAGLLGLFLVICGAQHFVYAGFVDTLVPAWIPPSPRFWTYFSAVALLAGGLGVWLPRTRWMAGLLAGVMIFLWVVLLHIPRSVTMRSAFELAGVFEALAMAGVAWLVAVGAPPGPAK